MAGVQQKVLRETIEAQYRDLYVAGPQDPSCITTIEETVEGRLPVSYKRFLLDFGFLQHQNFSILGFETMGSNLSSVSALVLARLFSPEFPSNLLPIEDIGNGWFACVVCPEDEDSAAPVFYVDLERPMSESLIRVAPDFSDYVIGRLHEEEHFLSGLKLFKHWTKKFAEEHNYNREAGGKIPRADSYRPYRFTKQDVRSAVVVLRLSRKDGAIEVDVFLTTNLAEYEPDAGAEVLAVFILSEAYKCGGTMGVRFTKNVENGRVPAALCRLAESNGITFNADTGQITPDEARRLYCALTEFSPETRLVMKHLGDEAQLSPEKACFAVAQGLWSLGEAEVIIRCSSSPDSVLGGGSLPEQRHLYSQDLADASVAVLAGTLDRKLARREKVEKNGLLMVDDEDLRPLATTVEPELYCRVYRCDEEIMIPWCAQAADGGPMIPAGTTFKVLLRPRNSSGLNIHLMKDLSDAKELLNSSENSLVFVLVPRDFEDLYPAECEEIIGRASELGVGILVAPEYMHEIARESARRLNKARLVREV